MARSAARGRRRHGAGARLSLALGATLCALASPAAAQRGLLSQGVSVQLIVTVPATEERALRLPGLGLGERFQREPHDTVLNDPRLGRVAIRVRETPDGLGRPRAVRVVWQ